MKKFIAGVITLSLVCGMSACGGGDSSSSSENTTATTTTTTTSEETTTTTTTAEATTSTEETTTTTEKPTTTTTTTTTKATTTTTTTAATTLKNPSSVSAWGWSGSGDFVATDLQVENYAIITASHDGSHNFILQAYNEDGSSNLLVNTIGWYSGSTLIVGSGTYEIEIKGDGNWSVNAYALSTTEDTSFSGTGDFVTPIFYAKNNNWNITNDGEHNFAVKQYSINTDRYDLLVNEIGSYSGIVKSDVGNETFFEITSEGNWSISPA